MLLSSDQSDRIGKRTFKADEVIFHEGMRGDFVYIIEEGKVEIYRGEGADKRVLEVLKPYSVFGELALIDDKPRAASVRALENTVCTTLDRSYIRDVLGASDPSVSVLIKVLMSIIRKYTKPDS